MPDISASLKWNPIQANFNDVNSAMNTALNSYSQAGNIFDKFADRLAKQEQQAWDNAFKDKELAEIARQFDLGYDLDKDRFALDKEKAAEIKRANLARETATRRAERARENQLANYLKAFLYSNDMAEGKFVKEADEAVKQNAKDIDQVIMQGAGQEGITPLSKDKFTPEEMNAAKNLTASTLQKMMDNPKTSLEELTNIYQALEHRNNKKESIEQAIPEITSKQINSYDNDYNIAKANYSNAIKNFASELIKFNNMHNSSTDRSYQEALNRAKYGVDPMDEYKLTTLGRAIELGIDDKGKALTNGKSSGSSSLGGSGRSNEGKIPDNEKENGDAVTDAKKFFGNEYLHWGSSFTPEDYQFLAQLAIDARRQYKEVLGVEKTNNEIYNMIADKIKTDWFNLNFLGDNALDSTEELQRWINYELPNKLITEAYRKQQNSNQNYHRPMYPVRK